MKKDRHRGLFDELERAVLSGAGVTTRSARKEATQGHSQDPKLAEYLTRAREAAYQITDEEVASLLSTIDEDTIFELTAAAALGAAKHRLEAALEAIGDLPE
jgi:hypothetical protein